MRVVSLSHWGLFVVEKKLHGLDFSESFSRVYRSEYRPLTYKEFADAK